MSVELARPRFRRVPKVARSAFWILILLAWGLPSALAQSASAVAPTNVGVFYLTNRGHDPGREAAEAYGGERGQAHFGRCQVQFTPIPVVNELAPKVPFYVPRESHEVQEAEPMDSDAFWEQLAAAVEATASRTVVVFVHGYNYKFARTCRMAAELQRFLKGKATVVMFSWPSNGRPTDYMPDQADVEWSVPLLAELLAQLGKNFGRDQVQVLAHSLGSRGAVFALERLGADLNERPLVGSLVLIAPDFDSQTFIERLADLRPLAGAISLYASSTDAALKVSQQLHGAPRLGEAGEFLAVAPGMETIDVSPPGRYQLLGHEYFYFHPQVAADLVMLLSTGKGAAERPGLRARRRDDFTYWELVDG